MIAISDCKQVGDSFLLDRVCEERLVFVDSSVSLDSREHMCLSVLISQMELIKLFDTDVSGWAEHNKGLNCKEIVK
jgi:hypothetical protein